MNINHYNITVDDNFASKRLDKILALYFPNYSRNFMQNILDKGLVELGGKVTKKPSFKPEYGEIISVKFPEEVKLESSARENEYTKDKLNIVFEDGHIIVLNKPAGLTVHPGAGRANDTLLDALQQSYLNCAWDSEASSYNHDESGYPKLIHRLDKDTTGLIIAAKTHRAYNSLSSQLRQKQIRRNYKALIWSSPNKPEGSITSYISKSPKDRTRMTSSHYKGKLAITHYKCIETYLGGAISLLDCQLDTGRTHQIRVHLSHNGNSVVGDQKYGNNSRKARKISQPEYINKLLAFPRQALHAYFMKLHHPITEKELEFYADLPEDFEDLLSYLRGSE
jgi:23S rRNA pseudouridine1911/1915/1917 synthase